MKTQILPVLLLALLFAFEKLDAQLITFDGTGGLPVDGGLLVRRSRLHPYLVHHVMRLVIRRSRELELCVNLPLRVTKREVFALLERILFDFVRRGRERYAL